MESGARRLGQSDGSALDAGTLRRASALSGSAASQKRLLLLFPAAAAKEGLVEVDGREEIERRVTESDLRPWTTASGR